MTCVDPTDPTILHWSHLRGAAFTSSFAEESAAMQPTLEWVTTNHAGHSLTICTDSHSLPMAIERRSPVTHHLRPLLNARLGLTTILWVPSHEAELCDSFSSRSLPPTLKWSWHSQEQSSGRTSSCYLQLNEFHSTCPERFFNYLA